MQGVPQAPRMRMIGPSGSLSKWAIAIVLLVFGAVIAAGWLAFSKTQGPEALATVSEARKVQIADLTTSLTRSGYLADGVEAELILTTPDFFRLTGRSSDAAKLGADASLVFIANENVHFGALEPRFSPMLRVNGSAMHVPVRGARPHGRRASPDERGDLRGPARLHPPGAHPARDAAARGRRCDAPDPRLGEPHRLPRQRGAARHPDAGPAAVARGRRDGGRLALPAPAHRVLPAHPGRRERRGRQLGPQPGATAAQGRGHRARSSSPASRSPTRSVAR